MNDEEFDALAAEYVLGTLASDERAHAEALIGTDPRFVEIVHQWERRLGELNVMVEAVEPPDEVWEKIKAGVSEPEPEDEVGAAPPLAPAPSESSAPAAEAETEADAEGEPAAEPGTDAEAPTAEEAEASPVLDGLESDLFSPEHEAQGEEHEAQAEEHVAQAEEQERPAGRFTLKPPTPLVPPSLERGADIFYLTHRMRRWRRIALGSGAIAALLAALIVLTQVAPGLIPAGVIHVPQLIAQTPPAPLVSPAAAPASRLVAVLQQQPSSPAFLLIVDPASRSLTVRRISAKEQAGHSYQLWVIASPTAKPLSLGVIGTGEYTQAPLPDGFTDQSLQAATYAISFEPAGGSTTGAPTGPVLFSGKLHESVAPPPPATPKT
jgi:anti-sigma-K factor RskA